MHIYVHIPYCARKCPYCGFYSVAGKPQMKEYFEALEKEIAEIETALGDPSLYAKDPSKAALLAERLAPAKEALDAAETRWLELSEV